MGRSCLFVPGIQDMNDIQTIAGHDRSSRASPRPRPSTTRSVEVPTSRSLVMTDRARDGAGGVSSPPGRPDAYNEDIIYYVTDEQFGYVAYLSRA